MSELGPEPDAAGWQLASAYVDDDVDATERARVESSPALLALVAELRELRDDLAAPFDAPAGARESAIAAALAAFDAHHGDAAVDTTADATRAAPGDAAAEDAHDVTAAPAPARPGSSAGVVAFPAPAGYPFGAAARSLPPGVHDLGARRRRIATWVTGAAAAVIVVVVGVVALRGGGGAGNELSSSKQASPVTSSAAGTRAAADLPAAAPATTSAAAASTAAGSVDSATEPAPAAGGAPGGAATTALPALTTPDQLLDLPRPEVATTAADAGSAAGTAGGSATPGTAAAATTTIAPGSRCAVPPLVVLATIDYQGIPALAIVDDVRHVREAVRLSDCVVLATISDGA